ncbi:MAG TPA: phosphomannomutase/phosphoglucomutase, partial [Candidatus Saccharimonadales bacterium]|nr:phosphomannomutase/phosphoglucomutase [Candidatus Saccharimonadales bacterium]
MNPLIFREYDIRGIAETELTDDVAVTVGRAFGTYIRRHRGRRVTLGQDVRLSSPRLAGHLAEGILSTGVDVVRLGVVPTPTLYFSVAQQGVDGGLQVTGSHNPIEYNGFKMCLGMAPVYGPDIQGLAGLCRAGDFETGSGTLREEDVVPAYQDMLRSKIRLTRSSKLAVDAGNGVAGPVAVPVLKGMGQQVLELYTEPDGRFPHHLPDPTVLKYTQDLVALVRRERCDLGIGWDGDADRIGAVDETGRLLWGDQLLGILAADVLTRHPGAKVIFDVKCSQGLEELLRARGAQAIMWKTGHALLKAKMREEGALIAGEMSGHMFFAENYYGFDDAIYATLLLLQILDRRGAKLSELLAEIPQYVSTPETRLDTTDADKFRIVATVRDYFKKTHPVVDIDGARVQFGDGWGLVRASNTQPVLVVRFEARTQERLDA